MRIMRIQPHFRHLVATDSEILNHYSQSGRHSPIGVFCLTLFVTEKDQAVTRLEKATVKTLGITPPTLGIRPGSPWPPPRARP